MSTLTPESSPLAASFQAIPTSVGMTATRRRPAEEISDGATTGTAGGGGRLTGARGVSAVRGDLLGAIEALRPASTVDRASRAWRPYHLLNLRYVEALDPTETARRLSISRSQFYREHEAAVTAVADVLRERGW